MVGNHLVAFYLLSLEWKLYLQILELSVEGANLSWASYFGMLKIFRAIQISWLCFAYPCLLLAVIYYSLASPDHLER